MTLNKNVLWTGFIFLCALNSPLFLNLFLTSVDKVTMMTGLFYVIGAITIMIVYIKTNKRQSLSGARTSFIKVILTGLFGIMMSWVAQLMLTFVEVNVLHQQIGSQNTQNITELIRQAPLFVVAVTIAGPIMEEFVFRFSIINWLNQFLNIWVAAILSSGLFAVMHGDGHYLLYGGLGFLFFLLYRATGSIWTSIITHVGMNTLVVIVQLTFQ